MKRIRVSFRTIIPIIGLIAITFSISSCATSMSGVRKNHVDPVTNENTVLTDGNRTNLHQSTSSNTNGKGMVHQIEKYEVTASFLNVRENASAKASIVGGLKKGDKVDVYGFEGNWAEIGFKNGKAFVYTKHINKIDVEESETQWTIPSETPLVEASATLSTNWSNVDIQEPYKKKKHKNNGFQWYEYVYKKVDDDGSTKVYRAAFNSDKEQITPIFETDNLSYSDGFFEVNFDEGHALYDKDGNCIIPSSFGLNMIFVHPEKGTITAYNSIAREETEKTISMDGKYFAEGDYADNYGLFDSNKKPISVFTHTNTHQEITLAPKKSKELSSETYSDDYGYNNVVVQENNDELERWESFVKYVEEGDKYFTNKHYAKAAKSYKKALKYQTDASVWFNLGLAQYSNDQFKMAKKSFTEAYEEALSNGNNPQLANRALEMKNRSAELAKEKSKQGWLTAAAITLAVVDVAAITYANYELQKAGIDNPFVYSSSPEYQAYINYRNSGLPGASTISFEDFKKAHYKAAEHDFKVNPTPNPDPNPDPKPAPNSKDCPYCDHSGRCKTCNGKGWFYSTVGTGAKLPCPNCKDGKCSHCHGTGKL